MQASQDSMIKGYQAAATTITDVNKKMAQFGQSVIEAKAYMQGLGQSGVGGALTSLIGGFTSGIKNIAEGMAALYAAEKLGIPLGKGGSTILGASKSLVGTGAKTFARTAGVVGTTAGAGYVMGQGAKVIGSGTGLNKSSTGRDIVRGGGIAAAAGTGALIGFGLGGPVGAVAGTVIGGIAGFFGAGGGSSYGGFGASFGAKGGAYSTTPGNTSAISPYSGQSNKQTLSSPIPGTAPTTMYGAKDPGMWNGAKNYHTGDDYAVPVGTSVKAVADGTVYDDSPGADFGVYVQVDHGNGYQTLYGHLQSRSVKIGQKVVTGQEIGKSGQSGNVTGPHLHFEVRKGKNNPVDPSQFLTGTGGTKQTVSGKTVSAPGTVLGTGDQRAWATDFLKGMGAPATSANIKAMTTWMAYEGGQWKNSAHYNPLNTTLGASGATDMNSAGVKSYTSYSQGLQSNISTLQENQRGYAAIRAALLKGNDTAGVLGAVNHSAWGTKIPGYGGGNSGFGASITAPQQGGSTNVQITVNIAQASQDEAVKFAKKVQTILEENNSISMMGNR